MKCTLKSVELGQQILKYDPCREEIHRNLMTLYARMGQRPLAIKQYERCCAILTSELDVAPMEETQILYAHIIGTVDVKSFEKSEKPSLNVQPTPSATLPQADAEAMMSQMTRQIEEVAKALRKLQNLKDTLDSNSPDEKIQRYGDDPVRDW